MIVASIASWWTQVGFLGVTKYQGTGCSRVYSENTNSDVYCGILNGCFVPTVQSYGLDSTPWKTSLFFDTIVLGTIHRSKPEENYKNSM